MYDPLINEPHPDVAEISISTDDVDIVATYGREARVIFVVDEGTTGVLKVGTRAEFEDIRDGRCPDDETHGLIRQFLLGEPQGPITRRRLSSGYEEDLFEAAVGQ